jgi:hypothetical protein
MPAKDFARVMGGLLRAESHQQAEELRNFGEYKDKLADPKKRDKLNADILDELLADSVRSTRLHKVWRNNPYFKSIVEPLMLKFTDSTYRDGWPSYKPTEEEMVKLHWVMKNWRNPAKLRADYYTPIRRFFTNVGFQWAPTKKLKDGTYTGGELVLPYIESTYKGDIGRKWAGEGDEKKPIRFKYSPSDRALRPLFVKKFGVVDDLGTGLSFQSKQSYVAPLATLPAPSTRTEKLGKLLQANRVIAKFREIIKKPKTTVAGMIRTEERLVRAFKELGMWTQDGATSGKVQFQAGPRIYRMVGPRLTSKELSKEKAASCCSNR